MMHAETMPSTPSFGFGRLESARERRLHAWRDYHCRAYAFGLRDAAAAAEAVAAHKPLESAAAGETVEPVADIKEEEAKQARCSRERARPPIIWQPIGLDVVQGNSQRRAPGIVYGLEFPWSEELLVEFGPRWLTKAFHAAGTLDEDNRVTLIIPEPKIKVTAGNNAGKFLFEVRYARHAPGLHTKLFAKIPFPLEGATASDRLSSSVYKQPMDFYEINTYRLLEASLPVRAPKFYYGDISNETSNYILITERVPFAEINGQISGKLKPFQIEGPYEKCKDWMLRGDDKEYYLLLIKMHAKIAAAHKCGAFGRDDDLRTSLTFRSASPADYGMRPDASSGEEPAMVANKLTAAVKFFAETAKVVFPSYVGTDKFKNKFRDTMMKLCAYSAEIEYWKHSNPDYVALGHQNLNMDNAYFWRDKDGALDCGIFDFGGFGSASLAHRLWWGLNCAEFDQVKSNLSDYIDGFIKLYAEFGGPALDKNVIRSAMIITCLQNLHFMVLAVPNCLTMCPLSQWESIKDRHDPRIASNVGGKSTLRTTLQVMNNGLRMLEELKADDVLEDWVQRVFVGELGRRAKTAAVIHGGA